MKKMRILAISGSPRKHKTDYMINTLLGGLEGLEVDSIKLSDFTINSCLSCRLCTKDPFTCRQQDDFPAIRSKLLDADVIVLGTPTYFDNVSGTMKNFFDRCLGLYWSKQLASKKVILLAVCGGQRSESVDRAIQSMEFFCDLMKMEIIGRVAAVDDERSKSKELDLLARELNGGLLSAV